ncbi:MAG TPA: PAS domain-containing protein [Stellaceae bacterium]|nr:PAS domain-containing protein [Stellaceae bacterium]
MIRIAHSNAEASPAELPGLDGARVATWAAALAAGEAHGLHETFMAKGGAAPEIVWVPPVDRLSAPQLRFLLRYWSELAGERDMPMAKQIDALEMRPALGYINLLDVLEGGEDFRYRVFGSIIAAVAGYDMTGRKMSALKTVPYMVELALATCRAVVQRGQPLLTEHRPPPSAVPTVAWHDLVLPLAGEDGSVVRLLVGSVPFSRDGRPILVRL